MAEKAYARAKVNTENQSRGFQGPWKVFSEQGPSIYHRIDPWDHKIRIDTPKRPKVITAKYTSSPNEPEILTDYVEDI